MLFDTHNRMTEEERLFGRELRRIWVAFARDGRPPDDLGWAPYDTDTRPVLRLDDTHRPDAQVLEEACAFWADRLPLR